MLKDIRSIIIQGASFESSTQLPILCEGSNPAKVVLLYGRNGSGKSTIARSFKRIKGLSCENIQSASILDDQGATISLTDEEKDHLFIFDENYVNENVRIQEDGLDSIVMLGEQAGLTELFESTIAELKTAESDLSYKRDILKEYNNSSSPKSPRYYINKMYAVLQQDDGWAGRKRKIENLRRNASVSDNTYKEFILLSPEKTRDELIVEFDRELKALERAQSGASKITADLPTVPADYSLFDVDNGNILLQQIIEQPELTEREKYLLGLVQKGRGEELKSTAYEFESSKLTICPKCHQPLTNQYKTDLIKSIQRVLSEEVEIHQSNLRSLILPELIMELEPFNGLFSYQSIVDQLTSINLLIQKNNALLQKKMDDPYTPISGGISSLMEGLSSIENNLKQLEIEKTNHNKAVTDTK